MQLCIHVKCTEIIKAIDDAVVRANPGNYYFAIIYTDSQPTVLKYIK